MKKTLSGIFHVDAHTEVIEREINSFFADIFEPLFDLLKHAGLMRQNASLNALRAALESGKVWYTNGVFSGEFGAAISKELRKLGATFEDGTFRITISQLPLDLRTAIAASKTKAEALHHEVLGTLNAMEAAVPIAATGLKFARQVDQVVGDLQRQFLESVSTVVDSGDLAVPADLTPEIAKTLSEQLTHNADIEVKNFTLEQIADLRTKVQQNLFAGGRPDRLEGLIQTQFGVNQRKARFIAENETSIAISKFREARYKSLGSKEYVWSTVGDNRVRHDHKVLDGRTFNWDTPPIADSATGTRANPGETWNCRCVALPVITLS